MNQKQKRTTRGLFAGAFLMAGMILSLTLFTCSDGSGNGKPDTGDGIGTTYTISKASAFNPEKAHGDFTIEPESAKEGETVTLTLLPHAGYAFNKWSFNPKSLNDTVTEGAEEEDTYTFEMPASNVTVSVTFKKVQETGGSVIYYTIFYAEDFDPAEAHGDFTIDPDSAEAGATITLELFPEEGYEFSGWIFDPALPTDPEEGEDGATYTFIMPANDLTIGAVFYDSSEPPFLVSKGSTFDPTTAHGDFTINGGASAEVPAGTLVMLEPRPDQDYAFGNWIFNPNTITATETSEGSGTYTFTTPDPGEDVTIRATFIYAPPFTVSKAGTFVPATAHGDFTIDGGASALVPAGATVTLLPTPATGYVFGNWIVVPATITVTAGTGGAYTFTMPTPGVAVTISATFIDSTTPTFLVTKATTFVPATANGDFTIDGAAQASVPAGATVTLVPQPVGNYVFGAWTFNPATIIPAETAPGSGIYTFTTPTPGVNVIISATFTAGGPTFMVSKATTFVPATAHGDFTINGGAGPVSVPAGSTITLATQPLSGYKFDSWTFNPATIIPTETAAGSGVYTFTTPPGVNVLISATFTSTTAGPTYMVAKPSGFNTAYGNFTINGGNGFVTVPAGTVVTLVPTPVNGYKFDHWNFTTPPNNTITATETPAGSGTYTFTTPTPGATVTITATFIPTSFTITKGAATNGNFTINGGNTATVTAADGATITLAATANNGYQFSAWSFVPALTTTAPATASGTFTMPKNDLTVAAIFSQTGGVQPTPGTGTKTITVKGGLGLPEAYPNASRGSGGSANVDSKAMHEGTRDITVTVTMNAGTITEIKYEDSIERNDPNNGDYWMGQGNNRALRTAAAGLVAALNTAKNSTAAYTPTTNFTGTAATAWNTYNTNIRAAVETARTAINAGKPNRTLTGGGEGTPWLVNGAPLNGTATAVGASFMGGSGQPVNTASSNPPTDMTVTVTVANGMITDIAVNTDDYYCSYNFTQASSGGNVPGGSIMTRIPLWIARMKNANQADVDTVTGASTLGGDYRVATERYLKLIAQRAFMKIVNEY